MESIKDLSDAYQDGRLPPGKVTSPEAEEFRKASRTWATGVVVVTVPSPDGPYEMHGMSASSFNVVSSTPRLVAVNVERGTHCHRYLQAADRFAINLLNNSQLELAYYFANRLQRKMEPKYSWKQGCPILDGTLSYFALRKWAVYDGGDHSIFVGEVLAFARTTDAPLVCCRGRFHDLGTRFFYEVSDQGLPEPGPLA